MTRLRSLSFLSLAFLVISYEFYGAEGRLRDNLVTQWNEVTQTAIKSNNLPDQTACRFFAILHVAIARTIRLYHAKAAKYPGAQLEPSAIFAAHYVLSASLPQYQSSLFDGLAATQLAAFSLTPAQIAASKKLGKVKAVSAFSSRINDGSQDFAGFVPQPPNGTKGLYQFTPGQTFALYPQLGHTFPYVVGPKTFDTYSGPYKVGSTPYNTDLEEVKLLGSLDSENRTAYETESVSFWADGSASSSHAGHWFQIAKEVLPSSLSLSEVAQAYALIGVAQFDGFVAIFYQKYKYRSWRPITAIRQGDGVHLGIPNWTPLLPNPPHPEYPSGHSVLSSSSAVIIAKYLKIKDIYTRLPPFTVRSEGGNGKLSPRNYTSLATVALEVGTSRIFQGVHFRKAINDAFDIGLKVAAIVYKSASKVY